MKNLPRQSRKWAPKWLVFLLLIDSFWHFQEAATGAIEGTKRLEVIEWAFGPDGVAPLFVRGGAKATKEENEKVKLKLICKFI